MTPATKRRIQKEFRDIKNNPIEDVTVELEDDKDMSKWKCAIKGAHDSPYKGGTFEFDIELPENFPFKAPTVKFKTKIYHPGIDEHGAICIPILRDEWKPTVVLSSVLSTIKDKLNNPSADDPFVPEIAAVLKSDKSKFNQTAKDWVKKYASS